MDGIEKDSEWEHNVMNGWTAKIEKVEADRISYTNEDGDIFYSSPEDFLRHHTLKPQALQQ